MKRGTVVWVDLSDTTSPEMGKVRPGIVVLGSAHNEVLNTVVVVPTSGIAPEIWPLRQLSHDKLLELDECLDAYLR